MRKVPIAIAAAVVAMAAFPATGAAAPPDTTTGTGMHEFVNFNQAVHVNARSQEGLDARGHIFWDQDSVFPGQSVKVQGEVTCHRVVGNTATVGARLHETVFGFATHLQIFINDDGEPGAGQDEMFILPSSLPQSTCPAPFEFEGFPIEKGDYRVHDR